MNVGATTEGAAYQAGLRDAQRSPTDPMTTRTSRATDPASKDRGATHDSEFWAERDARKAQRRYSGVVEGHPGIIESTHIEPLKEDYKEGGARSGQSTPVGTQGLKERVSMAAEGVANVIYGIATGDQKAKRAGKEALRSE